MRKERTARIHVKESPSVLQHLQYAAALAGADDFSTWVRDALRKAAAREYAKAERAAQRGEPGKGGKP